MARDSHLRKFGFWFRTGDAEEGVTLLTAQMIVMVVCGAFIERLTVVDGGNFKESFFFQVLEISVRCGKIAPGCSECSPELFGAPSTFWGQEFFHEGMFLIRPPLREFDEELFDVTIVFIHSVQNNTFDYYCKCICNKQEQIVALSTGPS